MSDSRTTFREFLAERRPKSISPARPRLDQTQEQKPREVRARSLPRNLRSNETSRKRSSVVNYELDQVEAALSATETLTDITISEKGREWNRTELSDLFKYCSHRLSMLMIDLKTDHRLILELRGLIGALMIITDDIEAQVKSVQVSSRILAELCSYILIVELFDPSHRTERGSVLDARLSLLESFNCSVAAPLRLVQRYCNSGMHSSAGLPERSSRSSAVTLGDRLYHTLTSVVNAVTTANQLLSSRRLRSSLPAPLVHQSSMLNMQSSSSTDIETLSGSLQVTSITGGYSQPSLSLSSLTGPLAPFSNPSRPSEPLPAPEARSTPSQQPPRGRDQPSLMTVTSSTAFVSSVSSSTSVPSPSFRYQPVSPSTPATSRTPASSAVSGQRSNDSYSRGCAFCGKSNHPSNRCHFRAPCEYCGRDNHPVSDCRAKQRDMGSSGGADRQPRLTPPSYYSKPVSSPPAGSWQQPRQQQQQHQRRVSDGSSPYRGSSPRRPRSPPPPLPQVVTTDTACAAAVKLAISSYRSRMGVSKYPMLAQCMDNVVRLPVMERHPELFLREYEVDLDCYAGEPVSSKHQEALKVALKAFRTRAVLPDRELPVETFAPFHDSVMLLSRSTVGEQELHGCYAEAVACEIAYNRRLLRQLLAQKHTTSQSPADFLSSILDEYLYTAVGDTKHYAAAQVLHNLAEAAKARNANSAEALAAEEAASKFITLANEMRLTVTHERYQKDVQALLDVIEKMRAPESESEVPPPKRPESPTSNIPVTTSPSPHRSAHSPQRAQSSPSGPSWGRPSAPAPLPPFKSPTPATLLGRGDFPPLGSPLQK